MNLFRFLRRGSPLAAPGSACSGCRWWVQNDAIPAKVEGATVTPRGECHVQNPRCYQVDRGERHLGQVVTRWPVTTATDFCGRLEPKPPTA